MNNEMPDRLRTAIGWTVAVVAVLVTAAFTCLITVFFGIAWAIIAGAAAGYGIARLATSGPDGGMGGADIIIFGWAALIVGLIAGGLWRLFT